ncbi:hypothetical protein ISS42_01940 [Candidatus Shapirobacteria bacterium]|nr:hypothetical protein [Candidatus Shapirobacteria bacterium]
MKKKKNFVLTSLVAGLGFWTTNWLAAWSQSQIFWVNGVVLALFVVLMLYFLFRSQLDSFKEILPVIILPSFLTISFSWFTPLLPSSLIWQFIFTVIYLGSFYLILLTENLFVVSSRFKAVPLYRTAFVTGFAFSLLIALLLFNAIFSLEFFPWTNSLLVGVVTFFLFYHLLWSVIITETDKKNLFIYTLIPALLVAQLALVISFWYLSSTLRSLYLVSWLYILGGVFQSQLRERLFVKILKEYIFIGGVALLALLFSAGW